MTEAEAVAKLVAVLNDLEASDHEVWIREGYLSVGDYLVAPPSFATQWTVSPPETVVIPEPTSSGYTHCACRDCMDDTVSSDTSKPELCEPCEGAGCTSHVNLPSFVTAYGLDYECQREDAYGN